VFNHSYISSYGKVKEEELLRMEKDLLLARAEASSLRQELDIRLRFKSRT
jgi:hypothetical protein